MKKRKIIGLLTVVVAIVAFTLTAYSQEDDDYNWGPAEKCCKEDLCRNLGSQQVPCGRTLISKQNIDQEPSYAFDFDGQPYVADRFGSYGYCKKSNSLRLPALWDGLKTPEAGDGTLLIDDNRIRDGKFIFDACECPEACIIVEGVRIGIQMIIETDGVFFAGPVPTAPAGNYAAGEPTIHFDIASDEKGVGKFCPSLPLRVDTMNQAPVFYKGSERVATQAEADRTESEVRNFGPVRYFTGHVDSENSKGRFITAGTGVITNPLSFSEGPFDSSSNLEVRAKVLESSPATPYIFTEQDADLNARNCFLWIDVPPMRVDPDEATPNADIVLKVRLIFYDDKYDEAGICQDCSAPIVCEGTRVVGKVCCDISETANCMFFPYAIQNLAPWGTGISITAREHSLPTNAFCELTLIDSAGNTATYRKVMKKENRIWSFMLDDIMSKFTMTEGKELLKGPVSLKVDSNYPMHGYSFMTDGNFGAGTLPTGCTPGECSP